MFIIYDIYNFVSWPLTPLTLLIPLTVSLSVVEAVHLVAEGRKCGVFTVLTAALFPLRGFFALACIQFSHRVSAKGLCVLLGR